jgi:phosphohistidine phosphatase
MKLYILRHANAVKRDPVEYPDDSRRPLADAGHKEAKKVARRLHKMGVQIDLILSSPYVRARETAEVVRKHLHLEKNRLVLADQLLPLGNTFQLIADIQARGPLDGLLLVGHEPLLSELISVLLSGDASLSLSMKKGNICCLDVGDLVPGKCATLKWLFQPARMIVY